MAENETKEDWLLKEAEILRADFLAANDGILEDAFLAACQHVVRLVTELEHTKHMTSAGFLRKPFNSL